jgi:phage/plasmid primase, P4 family, C-terminal domain
MSKEAAQNPSADIAVWFDGKAINEVIFCEEFLRDYPMITVNGTFFTVNGIVNDENRLKKEIYDRIKPYVTSNIAKRVTNLLDVMRMECCAADLLLYQDRIHVANGTYHLDGTFSTEKDYCRNRLPVAYHPEAPQPVTWLHFLSQLLEPEDILTLQEFIGYCFIPSTKGQKMLMLTGKGGEGKSRIGVVLRALLGTNMKTGSVAKVETSNFARADLEHELLMLDDDMKLEALPQTNNIKAIITAELPMDLERKRQQSYQGDLYVRFIGLGNGVLQALHDRSVGFFRRQIILTTKEKDPNRKDDPYIAEKMTAEAEGIFLWALEGLHRLIANDFRFTLSQSALDNLNDAVSDGNNIIDFLASEGYIRFRADYEASSKNLYAVYKQWCDDNALNSLSQKSFGSFLKQNESRYNLE